MGAHAFTPSAIAEIYRLKNRPVWNPLIVHVIDAESAHSLARVWPDAAVALADRFWPGPLSLVVERVDRVADAVNAGTGTVALRVPAHPVAQALLRECGLPLAAPSANRSEQLSPTRAQHVLRSLRMCRWSWTADRKEVVGAIDCRANRPRAAPSARPALRGATTHRRPRS
ncbi:L-threonylcarbamoyladenylate synthase [Streptomyces sp. L2]|uniref:L-threonylcarbamoyladenylate synthase n=1 Tax=Streptomyces sp. L2 TaxID=2162665 RepID=UPI0019D6D559|nr:L-threonylcarbamoyladenylate synthase [Streptomyces sp. L2]